MLIGHTNPFDSMESDDIPAQDTPSSPSPQAPQAAPMGRGFWAVMALIGFLVLLIIYSQVQGITRPVSVNLTGTHWEIVSYTSPGSATIAAQPGGMNLSFGTKNKTGGNGFIGCVQYSFQYAFSNNSFVISNKTETAVACSNDRMTGSQAVYLTNLENASFMRFQSGSLTFYDVANHPLLVFVSSVGN